MTGFYISFVVEDQIVNFHDDEKAVDRFDIGSSHHGGKTQILPRDVEFHAGLQVRVVIWMVSQMT